MSVPFILTGHSMKGRLQTIRIGAMPMGLFTPLLLILILFILLLIVLMVLA
ncbi:hypothetical protein [Paenibacillus tyrfis]|uniref:hypothetical protein n=1 Tax=Paenibacillus tyrfis TaxID=1501230 RepID=UPI000B332EBB|nr:hypothetical protein [Paenibacillus tyrfis]